MTPAEEGQIGEKVNMNFSVQTILERFEGADCDLYAGCGGE